MAKLLPPLIEGTIPAFYKDDNGMVKITIPFSINRAVSPVQIQNLVLKIKSVQSSSYLFEVRTTKTTQFSLEGAPWVEFQITEQEFLNKIKVGQFYKCQIAFIDTTNEVGYYSTISVGKYTTKPNIYIANLAAGGINAHYYRYEGHYSQKNQDISEKIYSYKFNVYDNMNAIIATSGELLHDSSQDVESGEESYDVYNLAMDLEQGQNYYIQYQVTTINNLTISTPKYKIVSSFAIEPMILARVNTSLNYEEGYIKVSLKSTYNNEMEKEQASGTFILSRACEDTNYTIWEDLYRFRLYEEYPDIDNLWKDLTIEQGKHYKYCIQQYSDKGLRSSRIISDAVYSDFEYAFLYDGEKQLKIKFNPKVTSFKTNVLEAKLDTIGSKYPFIFRNGNVYYHEFPISGLISYQMDNEELFINKEDLYCSEDLLSKKGRTGTNDNMLSEHRVLLKEKDKITNLNGNNIATERLFKLKVLEWLTNGKTKLFRSPTEGNFIVRLMNTSLSPNDQLGRMLHTFTCTAYEVADFNYENLQSFNLLDVNNLSTSYLLQETKQFAEYSIDRNGEYQIIYKDFNGAVNDYTAISVKFFDMRPGTPIQLTFMNGISETIIIGLSGCYEIEDVEIRSIELLKPTTGGVTYSYYAPVLSSFDQISNVKIQDIPAQRFIGEHNILEEIEYVYDEDSETMIKNPKLDIVFFYYLHATARNQLTVYEYDNIKYKYWDNIQSEANVQLNNPELSTLYKVEDVYDDLNKYYWDYKNNTRIAINDVSKTIYLNDTEIELYDNGQPFEVYNPAMNTNVPYTPFKPLYLTNLENINYLSIGNGVVADIGYQVRITDYSIEDDFRYATYTAKRDYETAKTVLENYLDSITINTYSKDREMELRNDMERKYNVYILTLVQDLAESKP